MIKAGIELDVFTAIAAGAASIGPLASRTGASARGLQILCDGLTVHGFLQKSGDTYALTPVSQAFLDRRSPASMASVIDFMAAPELIRLFLDDPTAFVRQGGAAGHGSVAPENPMWVKFAKAMVPFVAPTAQGLATHVASWPRAPRKVLDIAAGHGLFGIAVAKAVPDAQIVGVDWKQVLAVARSNAERAGVSDRYRELPGSAFEVDWGTGYDLVLLPNFLHHFDHATCANLLRKVRAGLSTEGRVLAVEFVPNEDRVSPPAAALFSFVMLASTPHGNAHTAADLAAMARDAGFFGVSVTPLPPSPQSLVSFDR
jgi:2-polyprenyl-3-methyl-5-hydroxy-6-metoxy-1,4-benzoquinol methylase